MGDGLCCPLRLREDFSAIFHGERICLPTTDAQQPHPSDLRHLRPLGLYWRPGPGAGARGRGRVAAGPLERWEGEARGETTARDGAGRAGVATEHRTRSRRRERSNLPR